MKQSFSKFFIEMATLSASKNHLVLSFINNSIVFKLTNDQCLDHFLKHEGCQTKESLDNLEMNVPIICSAFSDNEKYFACCVNKTLLLWQTVEWNLLSARSVNRSASSITFSSKDDQVAVADKSGDVYMYSTKSPKNDGILILGHISMLLDILVSPDSKYIISCDRDEKIRISCYPNAYNIQSFCLGHEEFVTCLNILPHNETILVSGSGDGSLRFWDYTTGKQLLCHCCNVDELHSKEIKPVIFSIVSLKQSGNHSLLCVQFISFKGILVYEVVNSNENNSNSSSSMVKCTFKQLISMKAEPWNICLFENSLWILKQDIENYLLTYSYNVEKQEFLLDPTWAQVESQLEKHKVFLQNIFKTERDINALYKRRFDNVQEYLKRKMMRIETNSKKMKS